MMKEKQDGQHAPLLDLKLTKFLKVFKKANTARTGKLVQVPGRRNRDFI